MNTYRIVVKPEESKDENGKPNGNIYYHVSSTEAAEIRKRWDNHQNIQVGESYIPWQRIISITAPPKPQLGAGPKYCGKCDKGWFFDGKTAKACTCNQQGIQSQKEYAEYLDKQPWHITAVATENQQSRDEYLADDPFFASHE